MSLDDHSADDASPKMAPRVILRHEIEEGTTAIRRPALGTLILPTWEETFERHLPLVEA